MVEKSLHPAETDAFTPNELNTSIACLGDETGAVPVPVPDGASTRSGSSDLLETMSSALRTIGSGNDLRVVRQNIDGSYEVQFPGNLYKDVQGDDLNTTKIIQVKLPTNTVQRLVDCKADVMKTRTRFYTITKYDTDGMPKLALLDQNAIVSALRVVCPTMDLACAYAISLNILVRYGVNADINGDGYISPEEWHALDDILKAQSSVNSKATARARLISLML